MAHRVHKPRATKTNMKSFVREVFAGKSRIIPEIPMCGWSRQRAARAGLWPHTHAAFEICLLAEGEVHWWVERETHVVRSGEIFITGPGERHGGVGAVVHPCELYWLHVSVRQPEEMRALLADLRRLTVRTFAASAVLQSDLRRLVEEHRTPGRHAQAFAKAMLSAVLALVIREAAAAPPQQLSNTVSQAIAFMSARLGEQISLREIAAAAGVSAPHLQRRFQQELHGPVGAHLTRLRLDQARALLQRNANPVTEIALAAGFSSSQYFATVFRRYFGMSPSTYRRSIL